MGTLDLADPASITDPAGYFAPWFERGDVHWSEHHRAWVVIGHEALSEAFRDAHTLSADRITVLDRVAADRPAAFATVVELLSGWMIFRDPPVHTRLRLPVRSAFTTRRVADLGPLVDEIVDDAIATMRAASVGGALDLTQHVSRPVPALVIGALLGVDPSDRPLLQHWSDDLASIVFSLSPRATPPDAAIRAAEAFQEFFGDLVVRAGHDDSLIGRIAELDDTFAAEELVGMCTMLLFAGHETTTSLIQNQTALLLERPDLEAALRADDALIETAIDEFLRVQGPARTMVRKVTADHERSGRQLRAGDRVYLAIAAANHDPRVFDRAERIDLTRAPNPHMSFGWGLHHCLGAALARREAASVLRALLRTFPTLEPHGPIPPLRGATMGFHRGPVRLVDTST